MRPSATRRRSAGHVRAEGAVAVVVLAVHVGGDHAAEGDELGPGRDRHEPAARQQQAVDVGEAEARPRRAARRSPRRRRGCDRRAGCPRRSAPASGSEASPYERPRPRARLAPRAGALEILAGHLGGRDLGESAPAGELARRRAGQGRDLGGAAGAAGRARPRWRGTGTGVGTRVAVCGGGVGTRLAGGGVADAGSRCTVASPWCCRSFTGGRRARAAKNRAKNRAGNRAFDTLDLAIMRFLAAKTLGTTS